MGDEIQPLILDFGSHLLKAGFAGDDAPISVFSSIVGRPKYARTMVGMGNKSSYFGDEAISLKGILNLSHCMENGIVCNWDDMEKVLHHTFYNELRVAPEEHPILYNHPVLNPLSNQEKLTQVSFETFSCPAMYVAVDSVLAMYSYGRTTGVSVMVGDGVTSTTPIYEGYAIPSAVRRMDIAGSTINRVLQRQFTERGYSFNYTAEIENVRNIKERLLYVALDYNEETLGLVDSINDKFKEYELPDGVKIQVGSERYRAPEVLFNPKLEGYEYPGVHELLYDTIMSSSVDTRSCLYGNIIMAGGTTLLPGFSDRIYKEIKDLAPISTKIKVVAGPERLYSVWIGGSILGSLSTFQQMWISKEEYDESGPNIYRMKRTF